MAGNSTDGGVVGTAVTRRAIVLGAGGLALAGIGRARADATPETTLKIGFVSPRTGALAGFGKTDSYVLDLARKSLASGLSIGGQTFAVEILDRDTQSDPSRAGQLARDLINAGNVDLMLATSTPETVNPVSDACEAAGVPCLSTIMPWEAWYFGRGAKPGAPSPFKWTYHFCFGVEEFAKTYGSQWTDSVETNKKIGVLYPNDADGNAIRAHLAPKLQAQGFTIVDPGPYEDGTGDYSAQIAVFKREKCQIFNSFPLPPDFAAFWRQAAQQGYTQMVKICQVAKTGLFPSDIEALGALGLNIASACYWHKAYPYKSALTGVSGAELADGYEHATGSQWTQQLGASMALIDAGIQALKESVKPKQKQDVATALAKLKTTTMIGQIDFTSGPFPNVSPTPVIGAQWIKAPAGSKFALDYVVTEHAGDPNVPIQVKLAPYHA
jgi:branched-chain amino acid transport system substrate-binding protein